MAIATDIMHTRFSLNKFFHSLFQQNSIVGVVCFHHYSLLSSTNMFWIIHSFPFVSLSNTYQHRITSNLTTKVHK